MGRVNFLLKSIAMGIFFLAIATLTSPTTKADEVALAGYTNGCFTTGCIPGTTMGSPPQTLLGLTYNSSTFSGITSSGFLAIGNVPGTPNINNLGSFTLNTSDNSYNGQQFNLRVTFTAPPGILFSNSAIFNATLVGDVTTTSQGGVQLNFDNTPVLFTFTGPAGAGSFLFSVNDVSVIPGGTIALSGQITAAQQTAVPEPTSMFLLGTGLVGIASLARKRLRGRV